MAADPKVYAFEEVAKHDKIKDCWLIINGKVYDVSQFMEEHPGGEEVMLAATAKDASSDFEDIGHSDDAREKMGNYCIGQIDVATVPLKRAHISLPQAQYNSSKGPGFVIKILQFLLPLVILGLALAVRRSTKEE
ncbi:Cytochrome b5 [Handroanthus impetiginosus]|uniref:Cytochrome b5 n=1 Tax=Handroanthus impetiginosus TaxID=429701 RepID=A0A2G9HGI5_9LAMI|nr:Cytochrome b5 [Handroanthus impetiginosus]